MRGRWKLRSAVWRQEFECEVGKIMVQDESIQERWNSLEHGLKKVAEKVCEQLKGGKKREETWWWNEEVAEVSKRKEERYKKWRKDRSKENLEVYKVLKKEARQEVASAMKSRWTEMASELEKGGSTMAFHIAKQRKRQNWDKIGMPCIQDENGNSKTEIYE